VVPRTRRGCESSWSAIRATDFAERQKQGRRDRTEGGVGGEVAGPAKRSDVIPHPRQDAGQDNGRSVRHGRKPPGVIVGDRQASCRQVRHDARTAVNVQVKSAHRVVVRTGCRMIREGILGTPQVPAGGEVGNSRKVLDESI
jgi:hypothetical protein